MSKNPSYARFEYTYQDLKDCLGHVTDELNSDTEHEFRYKLVALCEDFIAQYDENLMGFDDEPGEEQE